MERQSFYFLYVNLNSLTELALKQLTAEALAQMPSPEAGPRENLSPEERDARVMAGFENLDLSALDGLDFSGAVDEPAGIEAPGEQAPESGESLDIDRYMARAYSYEERLRPRVDDHYRRADLTSMDATLAQLPDRLSPLTGPLSAVDMGQWLTLYKEGNEALTDLAVQMRQLDVFAGTVGR
jgi:hypothetical protein